ncbi:hypothetical protein BCR36DRAFT_406490 [Piromyces finnis]|uniref:Uncharacterized protein n=1 Tax=Piromyces finnis TaxID=1754191 RepID=A0A1Y1UZR7_9FUNG|nr:hypothetical protein BCR36DRAFT_406490 [Piromyces finnis]|eukprot:ORX44131.1 hypothetical protein BCR36DRAFT_406490 [Piromyces finnis]
MTASSFTHKLLVVIQSLTAPVSISYFYWALIVLILHRKNWSTPSVLIAMIHWIFSSLSSIFYMMGNYYDNYDENNASKGVWLMSQVLYTCFKYSAQIVGDWYPMLLIINQDKTCRYIKITCMLINISKLMYMGLYIFTPFTTNSEMKSPDFYEKRHLILILISFTTIFYHATIFYNIRTRFCLKYKEIMRNQSFLTKFRRISQYRIMISSGYILCSIPFVIFYTFLILFDKRIGNSSGEYARNTFFNVPYYIIYIDQILLKNLVVVKPTSNAPPPYLYNRNSASSANSETGSKVEDHATQLPHSDTNDARPQVTKRPMLFNNWSAPEGWGKPEYIKPSEKTPVENQNQQQSKQQTQSSISSPKQNQPISFQFTQQQTLKMQNSFQQQQK